MAQFSHDPIHHPPIEVWYDGDRGHLLCRAHDRWQTLDAATGTCGTSVSYTITKRIGLSRTDKKSLEGTVESSLGIPKIMELKAKLAETTSTELRWEESTEESKTFSFTAPPCGKQTNIVYQLVRQFTFNNERVGRFFGRAESWQVDIVERLPFFDVRSNLEPRIDDCRCAKPLAPTEFDGTLNLDLGQVSLQVPFRATQTGVALQFERGVGEIDTDTLAPQEIRLEARRLPDVVLWLGNIKDERITGHLRPSGLWGSTSRDRIAGDITIGVSQMQSGSLEPPMMGA